MMMTRLRHAVPDQLRSIGTGLNFLAQEHIPKEDKRSTEFQGFGKQDVVDCPVCYASVKCIKAGNWNSGPNGRISGIKRGDLLIGRHREGGGTYSIKRGDVLCKGDGLPIPIKEDHE